MIFYNKVCDTSCLKIFTMFIYKYWLISSVLVSWWWCCFYWWCGGASGATSGGGSGATSVGGGQRGRETHSMPLFPSATHLHFTLLNVNVCQSCLCSHENRNTQKMSQPKYAEVMFWKCYPNHLPLLLAGNGQKKVLLGKCLKFKVLKLQIDDACIVLFSMMIMLVKMRCRRCTSSVNPPAPVDNWISDWTHLLTLRIFTQTLERIRIVSDENEVMLNPNDVDR